MEEVEEIRFDVGRPITRNASGAITGRLVVVVGDVSFPDPEWTDFIDILTAWSDAIAAGSDAVLYFMEGPFEVRLGEGSSTDSVEVVLAQRRTRGEVIVKRCEVGRRQMRSALARACTVAAERLRESGYASDADRFKNAASKTLGDGSLS